MRTKCGSPSKGAAQPDIVTSWGAAVTPDSVAAGFGYPRPQMTRDEASTFTSLNGLWEFELASGFNDPLPVGRTLNQTILVPFPLESCLSGAFQWPAYSQHMFYRVLFDAPAGAAKGLSTLLHFGAVDWNATAYLNGAQLGAPHLGGFDAFSFDVTAALQPAGNELIVRVFDPSNEGAQPNGKQRISAISGPGGDTYTPSSGIWQTSWLESVPAYHVSGLKLRGDLENLHLSVEAAPADMTFTFAVEVFFANVSVANGTGSAGAGVELVLPIPSPQLWTPAAPNLYEVIVTLMDPGAAPAFTPVDAVGSYFGMRTSALIVPASTPNITRPALNGAPLIFAGWLDQSFWPDGQFAAPSDDALRSDLQAVKDFGLNAVRLHQKINPQRWYLWADRLGVAVMQDFVQKYGGASPATVDLFLHDAKAAVDALYSHPSVVQWEIFNEDDCWQMFDVVAVHAWLRAYDPYRLIDTQSGPDGRDSMTNRNASDVSDGHSYPAPRLPMSVPGKYHMMGEL
jgi:beta-galactosidase/beta-glucuronidase